ncbi:MAG: insulinase family protein, partial [Candidatus Omnitrophica bacterium]|nr:insulinase family protein [Candidatus Omnitrophota bacterium]
TNIRDKLGMSYSIGSVFTPGLEPGCYIFYSLVSRENIDTVKKAMLSEIKKLRSELVGSKELESAKAELFTAQMVNLQTNSNFGVRIALDELYGLGFDSYRNFKDKMDAVSADKIRNITKTYLDPDKGMTLIIEGTK